jgi:Subtilase family/Thrombospondin type 3 repeat
VLSSGAGQTVAVVDTGVDADHPDLAGRVSGGYDWVGGDTNPDDDDPGLGEGHGTHIGGTIAAVRDNGVGIAGIAPNATIRPLRVLNGNGVGFGADVAAALNYAGDQNIRVVNASLGAPDPLTLESDAIAAHPGTLYVVAAGNGGANNDVWPTYPCNYALANVLCVGASDPQDRIASFSNYGHNSVDVFAPGVNILSTVPAEFSATGYERNEGTSMATPHVAATAALLLERRPSMTVAELKAAIMETAAASPAFTNFSVSGGRANALAALQRAGTMAPADADNDGVADASDSCPTVSGPAPTGCPPGDQTLRTNTPIDRDGDGKSDVSDGCPLERAKTADGCPIPGFSGLSKKVTSCRAGRQCTRGVRLNVRADRAATVTVTVERKRCNGKRCRWVRVARRSVAAPRKRARVTVRPLSRGAHRAVVRLSSSAGKSKPRTLSFKVR